MNESGKLNRENKAKLPLKMRQISIALCLLSLATVPRPAHAQVTPQATYGYDVTGNTVTVVYTDQTCVVHTYDSSGNRAATDITKASVPENPVYGDGIWGCFEWTP